MKRSDAFPSKYISKDDVTTPFTAVIDSVHMATLQVDEKEETKPAMSFRGDVKPLLLNNINWMMLEDMFGGDSDSWIGRAIELYVDPNVMYGGKRVGGVRVRAARQHTAFTNLDEATRYVFDNGIDPEDMKKALDGRGFKGFNSKRDSDFVYDWVQQKLDDIASEPLV
jgi:hypothetical protein